MGTTRKQAGSPGSAVFPDQIWKELIGRLGLSCREGEIARGVFEDRTDSAIAAELGISPHTVHTHFERLHRKLGVGDRVQLVLCITQEFVRLMAASDASELAAGAHRAVHAARKPSPTGSERGARERLVSAQQLSAEQPTGGPPSFRPFIGENKARERPGA